MDADFLGDLELPLPPAAKHAIEKRVWFEFYENWIIVQLAVRNHDMNAWFESSTHALACERALRGYLVKINFPAGDLDGAFEIIHAAAKAEGDRRFAMQPGRASL